MNTVKASTESQKLNQLFDKEWSYLMKTYPTWAYSLGHKSAARLWSDNSIHAYEKRRAHNKNYLKQLKKIQRKKLSKQDKLSYDLDLYQTQLSVDGQAFDSYLFPVTQLWGPQQGPPRTINQMPKKNKKNYTDILERLKNLPKYVDQTTELLKIGLSKGVTPPQISIKSVPDQILALTTEDMNKHPMYRPFLEMPKSVKNKTYFQNEAKKILINKVNPTYKKLYGFFKGKYLPGSRKSISFSALPNGKKWYSQKVREMTTTDLSPDEIHKIGLSEVQRIKKEMNQIIVGLKFKGSFKEFLTFLKTDSQFFYKKKNDLLMGYRDIAKRADAKIPQLFNLMPRLPYGIEPVPSYSEKAQTTAYYVRGSIEAGRAGLFYANTYKLDSRPKWEMEALTLHEAVPGHHLQISIAKELTGIPNFRKHGHFTAYVEGWGLYAESLGEELGFYKDPYSKFGQLTYEMWRAVRLVVDTGMHSKGWTRKQSIEYFNKYTGKTKHDIEVEVDRYIVMPAQALAYKIGELKIKELKKYRQKKLGDQFDIREFHDQILDAGALPLSLLEAKLKL
jgi:uncharacterized protein (DUF885 family)